jgi:hypothetical protein
LRRRPQRSAMRATRRVRDTATDPAGRPLSGAHGVDVDVLLRQTLSVVTVDRNDPDYERKRALAEGAFRRAMERRATGTTTPRTRLPSSKSEFPKLLCLDQNKWIDLARAHYDRADGAAFKQALEAVRRGVMAGRLVVPVTGANLSEAAEPSDEARRERLARFMVDLSMNHSLVATPIVLREELRRAVIGVFLERAHPETSLRAALLQRGMLSAATGNRLVIRTGDVVRDQLVTDAMYDPELSVRALTDAIDRETIERFREADRRAVGVVEETRRIDAHLSLDERRTLELTNLLEGKRSTGAALNDVLGELGVPAEAFHVWLRGDGHVRKFTDAVPGIDVIASLMLQRDLNKDHRAHPNDGKDFSFMQVALPYGNCVVAEKSWTHFARTSGLAERYGTVVETDARKLPELLEAAGCLV